MTYLVRLTSNARQDRDRALAWYDAEAPEQSERFIDEFYTAARQLEHFPRSGPVLRRGARLVSLRIFPYQLWYRVHEDAEVVEIVAVLHHRQGPDQLSERLQSGD